jgi:hypothetical protein
MREKKTRYLGYVTIHLTDLIFLATEDPREQMKTMMKTHRYPPSKLCSIESAKAELHEESARVSGSTE